VGADDDEDAGEGVDDKAAGVSVGGGCNCADDCMGVVDAAGVEVDDAGAGAAARCSRCFFSRSFCAAKARDATSQKHRKNTVNQLCVHHANSRPTLRTYCLVGGVLLSCARRSI
jgi:hypothetical protein